jgi:hypothetical protein
MLVAQRGCKRDSTPHTAGAELVALAVWTWVFSDRTAGESVQVAYSAAAMQLSYLARLQSGVGQSDHRAVVGWQVTYVWGQVMVQLKRYLETGISAAVFENS